MIMNDNDRQMKLGDLGSLKLPDIYLTGEEKTPKKPHSGKLSQPESNPGPLRDRRAGLEITLIPYLFHS